MDGLVPFNASDLLGKPAWIWLTFVGIVVSLLALRCSGASWA